MTRSGWRLLLGLIAICSALLESDACAFWNMRRGAERPSHFLSFPPGSPIAPQAAQLPPAGSQAASTFDYGYFGARTRRSEMNHREYYGEVRQTIFPLGR